MSSPLITTRMASAGLLFGGLALYHVSTLLDPTLSGYEAALEQYGEAMVEVVELRNGTEWKRGTALVNITIDTLVLLQKCVNMCITEKLIDKMVAGFGFDQSEISDFVNTAAKNLAMIARATFILIHSEYGEAS